MFKLKLRSLSVNRTIKNRVRYSSTNLGDLASKFSESKKQSRSNFRRKSKELDEYHKYIYDDKFIRSVKIYENCKTNLITDNDLTKLNENIASCEEVKELLNLIEPLIISKLTNEHLQNIVNKFNVLFVGLAISYKINKMESNRELVNKSAVFKLLLNHISLHLDRLDANSLVSLLSIMHFLNRTPQDQTVNNTFQELRSRLDNLNSNELANCLRIFSNYLNNPVAINLYFELNQDFVGVCKAVILSDKFDLNDTNLIIHYYSIFLNPIYDQNYEVINHLSKRLLLPNHKIAFKPAVLLLKKMKQIHFSFKENTIRNDRILIEKIENEKIKNQFSEIKLRFYGERFYPRILDKLIKKCNNIFFDTFKTEKSDESYISFYLSEIHGFYHYINFEFRDFYDERLLSYLVAFMAKCIESDKNDRYDKYFYRYFLIVIKHYAKFNIFDEKSLKLIYHLCCKDEKFKASNKEISHFYCFLSNYRLSFVNHQNLAKQLFDSPVMFDKTFDNRKNSLRILSELILNDVNDQAVFDLLIQIIENLDNAFFSYYKPRERFKRIPLAKAYLSMFSNVDNQMKTKLIDLIDLSISKIFPKDRASYPNLKYYKIDKKIQKNAFLSNEIHLDTCAIYDKSRKCLVSFFGYTYLFNKIDKIRLLANQELITFIECERLRGQNYELNYNFQLKKVLKEFNIKPIEVNLKLKFKS